MSSAIGNVGITGAGGNVGTTLTKGLSADYNLTLFDLKDIKDTRGGRFHKVDCADRESLKGIFKGLDALIHLAGDPRPNAPRNLTLRNNFVSTSLVFDEALRQGVKKIVFASSNFYHQGSITEVLEARTKRLITLDTAATPQCLYAESKVFAETVGRHLSFLGMQFVALRIGWTVPEDNPALYGGAYMRAVFCSHRDLVSAFIRALEVETDFMAAFAVSDNTHSVFDLAQTRKMLGFNPQDNSEKFL